MSFESPTTASVVLALAGALASVPTPSPSLTTTICIAGTTEGAPSAPPIDVIVSPAARQHLQDISARVWWWPWWWFEIGPVWHEAVPPPILT